VPVTVAEIARACGLSKGTVANILSGRGGYSAKSRALVERIARERAFTPGRLGRSLRERSTPMVGVLVANSLVDPFYAELLQGLSSALRPLEIDTMVRLDECKTADDLRASFRAMLSWRPRAIVALSPDGLQEAIDPAERGHWLSQALLVNVHHDPWPESSAVDVDRTATARLAVEHLVARGHRRIALLNLSSLATDLKYRLAVQAMREAGLRFRREDLVRSSHPTADEAGEARAQRLYLAGKAYAHRRGPQSPTAMFSWSDSLVSPFLAGFCNAGGRVPQDLAIVTVSESRLLSRLSIPLTSVGVEIRATARAVADLLKQVWASGENGRAKPVHLRLAPTLIQREST
jgi:DNA-binding LacI/PurR family transcriptional regulator